MMLLAYWGLQSEWLKIIVVAPLCWLAAPLAVQILGRWRLCSCETKQTASVRKWLRLGSITGWIFGGAVAFTAITLTVYYRDFILSVGDFVGGADSQALDDFRFAVKFRVLPPGVIAVVALLLTITARYRLRALRNLDEEIYL
jgi:hypothetical protein